MGYASKSPLGHPLRRFKLQRMRYRGSRHAVPGFDGERFGVVNTGNP